MEMPMRNPAGFCGRSWALSSLREDYEKRWELSGTLIIINLVGHNIIETRAPYLTDGKAG